MIKKILFFILLSFSFSFYSFGQSEAPDPLRFEEDIKSFEHWDRKNSTPDNPILFVGSSSIGMWKTAESFPGLPVINRGFGGSVISDIQYYYQQVILPYDPKVIVFYAGDNDVSWGISQQQVVQNYKDLVSQILEDLPEVTFVYIPIKPSSSRWNDWENMKAVNERIKDYNKQFDQLTYVDLATPLLNSEGRPDSSYFLDDQLHLNEQGYLVWNRIMRPYLNKIY